MLGAGAHVAIDCSGSEPGRATAIGLLRGRGRMVLVGEGNGMTVPEVSPTLIHPSITIIGSWVTSLEHMRELVDRLPVWDLHPEVIVTDRFGIDDADGRLQAGRRGRGRQGRARPLSRPPSRIREPSKTAHQRSGQVRTGIRGRGDSVRTCDSVSGRCPAALQDVVGEIGDRLDAYQPRLRERPSRASMLSLTVVARDLWLAVLLAMAAADRRRLCRGESRSLARRTEHATD